MFVFAVLSGALALSALGASALSLRRGLLEVVIDDASLYLAHLGIHLTEAISQIERHAAVLTTGFVAEDEAFTLRYTAPFSACGVQIASPERNQEPFVK